MTASAWQSLRELVLLPGAAALMPWRAGFRWLRRKSHDPRLYREACDAAYAGARTAFAIDDPDDWMQRQRLVRLVDHTDLYLVRTRSARWLDRHVDVEGAWPAGGPFIAMTFHWGAGLWALAHLNRGRYRPRLLAGPAVYQGDLIAYRYGLARNAAVARASGGPPIYTGGATAALRDALAGGNVVVALYDLPSDEGRSTIRTTVCGRPIRLPGGLARIAAEQQATIVPFSMGIDPRNGRRRLRIEPPFTAGSAQTFADRLGDSLTVLLTEDSAAWHFAAFAPYFFTAPADHSATP